MHRTSGRLGPGFLLGLALPVVAFASSDASRITIHREPYVMSVAITNAGHGISRAPVDSDPVSLLTNSARPDLSHSHSGTGHGPSIAGMNASLDSNHVLAPDTAAVVALPSLADTNPPPEAAGVTVTARVLPNPTRGAALLEYSLTERSTVSARLFDATGRVVRTLLAGTPRAPGRYSVPIPGSDLRPGVYFYEMALGRERVQGRVIILR